MPEDLSQVSMAEYANYLENEKILNDICSAECWAEFRRQFSEFFGQHDADWNEKDLLRILDRHLRPLLKARFAIDLHRGYRRADQPSERQPEVVELSGVVNRFKLAANAARTRIGQDKSAASCDPSATRDDVKRPK